MATLRYNARVYEDTAENFAADETIYGSNDLLFATDTGEFKKGNGTDSYADLPAIGGGGGEPAAVAWADVTGKPAVIAAGADQAAARSAIGAGTSNLAVGTTASTAAAGNHTHSNYATTADLSALEARVAALEGAGG